MIDKIFLENFKAFRQAEFELKPITILVGPNNSGKSTLIQSIILIQQTLLGVGNSAINLNGIKNFGNFNDLVNQKSGNKEIRIGFDFADGTSIKFTVAEEDSNVFIKDFFCNTAEFKYSLIDLNMNDYDKGSVSYSQKCNIEFDQETLVKNKIPAYQVEPIFYRDKFFLKISDIGESKILVKQYFEDLFNSERLNKNYKFKNMKGDKTLDKIMNILSFYSNIIKLSNDFYKKLEFCFSNIQYIGPLRHPADRFYEKGSFNYVGVMGEHAVQILADNPKVKDDVENYFADMDIANNLNILINNNDKTFEFRVKMKNTDDEVNFADIGFGASQVLPIIVQSSMSNRGLFNRESLIIIEQPELHLHPKVQASLADFFVELASDEHKFLLETHSDYLLERLRYNIIDGKIPTEDVAIYYIEQNEAKKCSTITKIDINSKGQYTNLPEDYITNFKLEETRKIARKLLENL